MIKAFKKDEDLILDFMQIDPDPNHLVVWWLGQSGYLIYWNGLRLLFDPYLSDSLTKKYHGTDKPHVRISERVVDPALLPAVDFITSSHSHTDHLDAETLTPIVAKNPNVKFIIPESIRSIAADRSSSAFNFPIGMNAGEVYQDGLVRIVAIPAAHEALDRDDSGNHLYLGYIVVLGPWTIYHSGDTVLYPGMVEQIKPFKPDLAFLPINGSDPGRKVSGNLNSAEAVWLAEQSQIKLLIPGHYHMFEFNTVDPDEFITLADEAKIGYRVLQIGERLNLKL